MRSLKDKLVRGPTISNIAKNIPFLEKNGLVARRDVLKALVGSTLGVLVEGCESYTTDQNFEITQYDPLTHEPKRTETPLEDAQIMALLSETIQVELGICPDFSKIFKVLFDGQNIKVELLVDPKKDFEAAQKLLQEAGFRNTWVAHYEDGIIFSCENNGRYLYIVMNPKGITIKGQWKNPKDDKYNFFVANIKPSDGTQNATPTALAVNVQINKVDIENGRIKSHRRKAISGDGAIATLEEGTGAGYFQFQQGKGAQPLKIDNTGSFLQFLQTCQSTGLIQEVLATERPFYGTSVDRRPFFKDIDQNTARKLFELFPKNNLELWSRFLNLAFQYKKKDISLTDEYRAPQTTLHSGWGDCDDYAVINAFWAYLHGYKPFYLEINLSKPAPDGKGNMETAHVFVWYKNEENQTVILDNDRLVILEKNDTYLDYINQYWPDGEIRLNEEVK